LTTETITLAKLREAFQAFNKSRYMPREDYDQKKSLIKDALIRANENLYRLTQENRIARQILQEIVKEEERLPNTSIHSALIILNRYKRSQKYASRPKERAFGHFYSGLEGIEATYKRFANPLHILKYKGHFASPKDCLEVALEDRLNDEELYDFISKNAEARDLLKQIAKQHQSKWHFGKNHAALILKRYDKMQERLCQQEALSKPSSTSHRKIVSKILLTPENPGESDSEDLENDTTTHIQTSKKQLDNTQSIINALKSFFLWGEMFAKALKEIIPVPMPKENPGPHQETIFDSIRKYM